MRLFFAAWPDPALRRTLATRLESLPPELGGRRVPVLDLHVTLAFLGAVPKERLPEVVAIAAGLPALNHELRFDGLDYWSGPRILVATASRWPPAAAQLHAAIVERCVRSQLPCEAREFKPHLTLVRGLKVPCALPPFVAVTWPVAAVTLVDSRAAGAGPRYLPLASLPLRSAETLRSPS